MRVLVTGGAGYIGSHTARVLVNEGHDVVVLDSLERGSRQAVAGIPLVVGSVADRALLARVLEHEPFDAVVHFAAWKAAEESMRDPGRYFDNNVAGTLALLDALVEVGAPPLVYSSSCAVYGTPRELPVTEDAPTVPENPYGESKLLTERLLPWYERAHGLRWVALRYFNAAGAQPDGSNGEDWSAATNLVPVVLGAAAGRRPYVPIFGTDYPTPDGTAVRDYVHVLDLADAHARAIRHLVEGGSSAVVNVGTGRGTSVRELIDAARRVTGRAIPERIAPRRPGDPAAIWADAGRAASLLGWTSRFGIEDIVASAWRWHSLHPEGHRVESAAAPDRAAGSRGKRQEPSLAPTR